VKKEKIRLCHENVQNVLTYRLGHISHLQEKKTVKISGCQDSWLHNCTRTSQLKGYKQRTLKDRRKKAKYRLQRTLLKEAALWECLTETRDEKVTIGA
jgi:hypothetical protein